MYYVFYDVDIIVRRAKICPSGGVLTRDDPFGGYNPLLEQGIKAFCLNDYEMALSILLPIAEQGEAGARCIVGIMYWSGWGTEPNILEAVRWLREAAEQGYADACTALGCIYQAGGPGLLPDVDLNGSRANPNASRDIFQDFDILYLVTEVASFTSDPAWINRFGELMILQVPEAMHDPPPLNDGRFTYLMLFTDGNRIDLTLFPIAKLNALENDSLSLLLLDKDNLFQPFAAPSERDYLPSPPTAKAFSDCCNEFWWVCPSVAKGLWREEILYAKHVCDRFVRDQLMKMLTWYAGMKTQFSRSPGKFGKHLKQYLEPELWDMVQQTYSDAGYEKTWDALETMCNLFRITAIRLAEHFGLEYPYDDDEKVSLHLRDIRLQCSLRKQSF